MENIVSYIFTIHSRRGPLVDRQKQSITDGYDAAEKTKMCLQQHNNASIGTEREKFHAVQIM